jgi:hypothetical protein
MREQLLKKQKELLELQQKKLELELLQTKARLEEQQKQLERQTGHLQSEQVGPYCTFVRFPGAVHRNMEIFIATDTASVQLFFNIFATGIQTFVIPWDQLLNTCVVEDCLVPGIGTTV